MATSKEEYELLIYPERNLKNIINTINKELELLNMGSFPYACSYGNIEQKKLIKQAYESVDGWDVELVENNTKLIFNIKKYVLPLPIKYINGDAFYCYSIINPQYIIHLNTLNTTLDYKSSSESFLEKVIEDAIVENIGNHTFRVVVEDFNYPVVINIAEMYNKLGWKANLDYNKLSLSNGKYRKELVLILS